MTWVVVGAGVLVLAVLAVLAAGSLAEPGGPDEVAPGHDED